MLDRSWMENPDNSICQDCGGEVWAFMVHDAIWLQAGYQPKGFACRACLAKRLGRPLVNDDFQNVPINWHNVPGFMTEERMAQLMDGFFSNSVFFKPSPGPDTKEQGTPHEHRRH